VEEDVALVVAVRPDCPRDGRDRSSHERRGEVGAGYRRVSWHRPDCAEVLHAAEWMVTGASRRGISAAGWVGLVMDALARATRRAERAERRALRAARQARRLAAQLAAQAASDQRPPAGHLNPSHH